MAAPRLQLPPHPVARDTLPFETGDEFPRDRIQLRKKEGERLGRRLLHGQDLDQTPANVQAVAVTLQRRVGKEVVQVRVVRQAGRRYVRARVVVDQPPQEPERLPLVQSGHAKLGQLNLQCVGLVAERGHGTRQLRRDHGDRVLGRQPRARRCQGRPAELAEERSASEQPSRRLEQQHEVQVEVVEILTMVVEEPRAPLDRFVGDRVSAGRRFDRRDHGLQHVLIEPTVLIQQSKSGFQLMGDGVPLTVRHAFEVHAVDAIDQAEVAGLGDERAVVNEAPGRQYLIEAARLLELAHELREPHHDVTTMFTGVCLPGSYRRRALDDASRIRSIWGSRLPDQSAKP